MDTTQGSQRGFLRNLFAVLLSFAAILAPIQPTEADELIMKDGKTCKTPKKREDRNGEVKFA